MDQTVVKLISQLQLNASEELVKPMEAYMKDKFQFLGIKAPIRRFVLKSNFNKKEIRNKQHIKEIISDLWQNPYRECQYCAVDIARSNVKLFDIQDIEFFEGLITSKSWWDTVDHIAVNIVGSILFNVSKENWRLYSEKWILSNNLWLQRTSIIFQLSYKTNTDFSLLSDNILATVGSNNFFIRKAAGWALREHTRTNRHAVLHFVDEYCDLLSPLTKREALRLLNDK